MRHGKFGRKLGRTTSHRIAMLRNMVTSMLKYEKIVTTDIKAKELRRVADKMITLGKRGDLHARRQALSFVRDPEMVGKLFSELAARFKERAGGYTRIIKTGYRKGDSAPMAVIEFMPEAKPAKQTKAKKKASAQA